MNNSLSLNYEAQRVMRIDIEVQDSGSPALSYRQSLLVSVMNVLETPILEVDSFNLPEMSKVGTLVGIVVARADLSLIHI